MNDHLSTVMKIYEAFGKGDVPIILGHMADDVQWEQWADNSVQKTSVLWVAASAGAGVGEFFQALSMLVIKDFDVLSIMAGGNQVVAEIVVEADVPNTGGHFRGEKLHLWTFNDAGKVIRLRHYLDTVKISAVARASATEVAGHLRRSRVCHVQYVMHLPRESARYPSHRILRTRRGTMV